MNNTNFSNLISSLFNSTNISFNKQKLSNHNRNSSNFTKNILKNTNSKKQKYISLQLDNLIDEYLDYCNYTNKEYYKAGFIDCLNLILPAIFPNID